MLINPTNSYNQTNDIANNQVKDQSAVLSPKTAVNKTDKEAAKANSSADVALSSRSQKLRFC